MQNITFYVAAGETLGLVRDYANAQSASPPTLVRGVAVCLRMRLFANNDSAAPYPLSAFENVVSWQWAMDNDFNEATGYKLTGDSENIAVSAITETVDGDQVEYTEISIPISQMNTLELAAWLGTAKSLSGLHGELVGFDAEGRQIFILQVENFTIRNRITSLGDPIEIEPDFLTAGQVRALIASGLAIEFSENGEDWQEKQMENDAYIRIRSAASGSAVWSQAIRLIPGQKGDTGESCYCYVAYASNADGADFSLIPTNDLKYRAELHTQTPMENPTAEDFSAVQWVKYIGDDGTGVGDMVKSVYDTDEDGKVNAAAEADHASTADAVPWTGVSGKPASYPPETHSHAMTDFTNPVFQKVMTASNPQYLLLDTPIIRNSTANGSGTIALDFSGIKTASDGTPYTPGQNEMLTWEYHALCSTEVNGVTLGSIHCAMTGINIPDTLELVNGVNTYHVFVIRALYSSVNQTLFQANYAYSYEA